MKLYTRGSLNINRNLKLEIHIFCLGSIQDEKLTFTWTISVPLASAGVEYKTRNVLADPELRNGIKEFRLVPGRNFPLMSVLVIMAHAR